MVANMLGSERMGNIMVKEQELMRKGNGKETNMKENGRMEKDMGMEHTLGLMVANMLENGSLGKNMDKEHTLCLLVTSMLENSRMGTFGTERHTE